MTSRLPVDHARSRDPADATYSDQVPLVDTFEQNVRAGHMVISVPHSFDGAFSPAWGNHYPRFARAFLALRSIVSRTASVINPVCL